MYQVPGTVPSIVVDAGSHTFKAGTAGEDLPQVLIPSYVARDIDAEPDDEIRPLQPSTTSCSGHVKYKTPARAGHEAATTRKDNVDLSSPFDKDGLINDWDLFETLLSHTLTNELRISGKEHALLLADPNHNGRKIRERLTELLFEKFDIPAIYLARSAVLSAFANGRTTGVVLDVGYSGTSAVPVEDGTIVKGKFIRTEIGGKIMNDVFSAVLQEKDVQLKPVWSYKRTITGIDSINNVQNGNNESNLTASKLMMIDDSNNNNSDDTNSLIGNGMTRKSKIEELQYPKTTDSFWDFSRLRLLEQVKAGLCAVYESSNENLKALPNLNANYELPDGNIIDVGVERYQVAEETIFGILPHTISSSTGGGGSESRLSHVNRYMNNKISNLHNQSDLGDGKDLKSDGLHGLVVDAIKLCDQSIHRDMYAGVCLTGGTSDMTGLFERLSVGLVEKYHKVRILAAAGSNERKYCGWTGGSILATFAEHQKNWLSRSEFDENGSSFIHRKCQ